MHIECYISKFIRIGLHGFQIIIYTKYDIRCIHSFCIIHYKQLGNANTYLTLYLLSCQIKTKEDELPRHPLLLYQLSSHSQQLEISTLIFFNEEPLKCLEMQYLIITLKKSRIVKCIVWLRFGLTSTILPTCLCDSPHAKTNQIFAASTKVMVDFITKHVK